MIRRWKIITQSYVLILTIDYDRDYAYFSHDIAGNRIVRETDKGEAEWIMSSRIARMLTNTETQWKSIEEIWLN